MDLAASPAIGPNHPGCATPAERHMIGEWRVFAASLGKNP
jgi:hypothetical protein